MYRGKLISFTPNGLDRCFENFETKTKETSESKNDLKNDQIDTNDPNDDDRVQRPTSMTTGWNYSDPLLWVFWKGLCISQSN